MIIIDRRESVDLVTALTRLDVPSLLPDDRPEIEFGDVAWEGNGPTGKLTVGVERKRLDLASQDLIQSIQSRRLSWQLRGMRRLYDRSYLVVEGVWRCGQYGEVEVMGGRDRPWRPLYHQDNGPLGKRGTSMRYDAVTNYLTTQVELAGVRVWRTGGVDETAAWLAGEYKWWQKVWTDHHSHDQLYVPPIEQPRNGTKVSFLTQEPDLTVKWAHDLTGIDAKAWDVAAHFASAEELAMGTVEKWRSVTWRDSKGKTKRIGKEVAERIVDEIRRRRSK